MSLQITRLRVDQLRQFRHPFELTNLEPGLNILTGPNEAGKSTLVRAIRAAFFERYKSRVVSDLRPWGDGSAMPSVEIDFILDNEPGRLFKSFLTSQARCTLSLGRQSFEGQGAEDHLAQLFGFGFPGRGVSQPEHWGIPGLLWVEQGTLQELASAAAFARDHIHHALQEQVSHAAAGSMAATGGDELLAQFQSQRDELLTQQGKPRSTYQEAIQQADHLQHQLAELDGLIATYQQQVDQLATLRTQHQLDEQSRPWDALRGQLDQAKQAEQALQHSAQQLADAQNAQQRLDQQHQLLMSQIRAFEQQQRAAERRLLASKQADEQLQQAITAGELAQQHADQANQQAQRARADLALSRQETTRASLQRQMSDATDAHQRYKQALADAIERQNELDQLKAQSAICTLTKADVDSLRKLDRQGQDLNLQRQAVSTRLQFELQGDQAIAMQSPTGADSLQGQGERLIAETVTLSLPGLGQLTITPGGQDLNALARDCADVQAQLHARLQALGVADLAQAEAQLTQQQELLNQIKLAQQALELIAPKGLEPLKQALAQAEGQIKSSQTALAQLPSAPDQPTLPMSTAEAAQQAADQLEASARQNLVQAQQQRARVEVQQQTAQREVELAQAELNDPERQNRQQETQSQLLKVDDERGVQSVRVQELTRQREEARPDIVRQDIDRLTRSIDQQEKAHQQRHTQIQVLENTLQQAGAQGLEEQRQTQAGELDRSQRRVAELRRRAQALDLLCTKLQGKRQAALASLQAPLQKHLQHYLQLLFPHASVQVGEKLTPDSLVRKSATGGMEVGDFDALSFGAREQLALISRFAYADLLREAGRPTLLILDDALVHSDTTRLALMKRVIFDAAQRHQILLFTCHPSSWTDMGAALQSLIR